MLFLRVPKKPFPRRRSPKSGVTSTVLRLYATPVVGPRVDVRVGPLRRRGVRLAGVGTSHGVVHRGSAYREETIGASRLGGGGPGTVAHDTDTTRYVSHPAGRLVLGFPHPCCPGPDVGARLEGSVVSWVTVPSYRPSGRYRTTGTGSRH